VATVQPAEGPSLGVAPVGTCMCSAVVEKNVLPARAGWWWGGVEGRRRGGGSRAVEI
jgi:hypothetical protein